jgi:hypothetical protein
VKIKGTGIRSALIAIERLYGADAVVRVKAVMPPRLREVVDKVHPLEWYPVEVSAAVHLAVRDVIGGGSWDASHAIGREAARVDFTGIYKVLVRTVQYDTIWDRIELAWTRYASAGEAKWYERGPGHAKAFVSGVAGYNNGLWASVAGRCEGMLLLSGARGAAVSMIEPANTSCSFEALWLES